MDEKIIWLLILTVLILIKDGLVPLIKRINGKSNTINIDRLYQEFKDFKDTQEKLNDKVEGRILELEKGKK